MVLGLNFLILWYAAIVSFTSHTHKALMKAVFCLIGMQISHLKWEEDAMQFHWAFCWCVFCFVCVV